MQHGLVDYAGSDDSSDEGGNSTQEKEEEEDGQEELSLCSELSKRLPPPLAATPADANKNGPSHSVGKSALYAKEDTSSLPQRQAWELEMERELQQARLLGAEGVGKKKGKKAGKGRVRIPALPTYAPLTGGTGNGGEDSGDEDERPKVLPPGSSTSSQQSQGKHSLLAMLPQPKSKGVQPIMRAPVMGGNSQDAKAGVAPVIASGSSSKPAATRMLLPMALINRQMAAGSQQQASKTGKEEVNRGRKEATEESDSDENEGNSGEDFFGLSKTSTNDYLTHAAVAQQHAGPSRSYAEGLRSEHPPPPPQVYMGEVEVGPSRPSAAGAQLPSQDGFGFPLHGGEPTTVASSSSHPATHRITNTEAQRLIYEKDLAGFGRSRAIAATAVESMLDVSVDTALGPNVHENLLRNLSNKAMAKAASNLAERSVEVMEQGGLKKAAKKDPKTRMAKRKHQITHLAGLAVAREEELQEMWAQNHAKKRQSSQKYGF